ncbi:hypothetical protein [Bradyrhizobium sp.]|uniref:hypothetical protein n=1 Tax=Bradyrhizobium sp. TaxID=376 RepID=UPI001D9FE872|nr:hypothetical protein [Bradyrhizobium sp.]MBV8696493.1 hypothetical protein [Bradyrhizobium sp.]MBV8921999.1 hypothetical protein [Bradyrhizobium sp.]MBV9980536.1 hypothetical protein [Bradyrhizobium sp.]
MIDPESAAPARGMLGELDEDSTATRAQAGSRVAPRLLQTANDDKAASDGDGHAAGRRAPTMWR